MEVSLSRHSSRLVFPSTERGVECEGFPTAAADINLRSSSKVVIMRSVPSSHLASFSLAAPSPESLPAYLPAMPLQRTRALRLPLYFGKGAPTNGNTDGSKPLQRSVPRLIAFSPFGSFLVLLLCQQKAEQPIIFSSPCKL